jgi:hypothetical protein
LGARCARDGTGPQARCNDTIDAGLGNDTVMANDRELDSISCGSGVDVVFVDQADLHAEGTDFEDFVRLTSCETIYEPELPVEVVASAE